MLCWQGCKTLQNINISIDFSLGKLQSQDLLWMLFTVHHGLPWLWLSSWRCLLAFLLVDVVLRPVNFSLLNLTMSDSCSNFDLLGTSSLVTWSCQETSSMVRRQIWWNTSSLHLYGIWTQQQPSSQTTTAHVTLSQTQTLTSQHMSQKSWLNKPTPTGSRTQDDASNSSQKSHRRRHNIQHNTGTSFRRFSSTTSS